MTGKPKITTLTLNQAIDLTISVPNFRAGQVNRALFSEADPGGKGVNVASWLADYGFDVAVTGFLGAENDQISAVCSSRRVSTTALCASPAAHAPASRWWIPFPEHHRHQLPRRDAQPGRPGAARGHRHEFGDRL